MSKERAAKIANTPDASKKGGKQSGKGGDSSQGGTTAQKKKAGRKGGKAAAKKSEVSRGWGRRLVGVAVDHSCSPCPGHGVCTGHPGCATRGGSTPSARCRTRPPACARPSSG